MDFKHCLRRLSPLRESADEAFAGRLQQLSAADRAYLLYSVDANNDIRDWYNGVAMTVGDTVFKDRLLKTFQLVKAVWPPDSYPPTLYRLVMVDADESLSADERQQKYLANRLHSMQVTEHPLVSWTTNYQFTRDFYDAFYKRLKQIGVNKTSAVKDAVIVTAHIPPDEILTTTQTVLDLARELARRRATDPRIDYGWEMLAEILPEYLFAAEVICDLPTLSVVVSNVEINALHN